MKVSSLTMPKKMSTPDEISQALALREAGYTTLSISRRLSISVRTLQRHFSATGTKKGAIKEELLRSAKADLLARVTCDQTIKEEAARLVADDIAHAAHLRELMLEASEHMKATCLQDVVQLMRAAAAYSTAIKNTSDIIRHSLRVERLTDVAEDNLPELVVRELTTAEVEDIREKRKEPEDAGADEDIVVEA
jgi:AraC-like DNA-binding protein